MNLSFAGEGKDADMERALKYAESRDVVVVIAAANDHLNLNHESVYPAKYNFSNTITVAASDRDDKLIQKSNWGDKFVHLAVPGDRISGIWLGEWDHGDGTSDATAVMSGAVALLRSAAPQLKASQVKAIFLATVRPSPFLKNKVITGGVLDLEAAVDCATQSTLPCLRKR
jgi:subtilisin family serine protease